jgi:hypothetical protein
MQNISPVWLYNLWRVLGGALMTAGIALIAIF